MQNAINQKNDLQEVGKFEIGNERRTSTPMTLSRVHVNVVILLSIGNKCGSDVYAVNINGIPVLPIADVPLAHTEIHRFIHFDYWHILLGFSRFRSDDEALARTMDYYM